MSYPRKILKKLRLSFFALFCQYNSKKTYITGLLPLELMKEEALLAGLLKTFVHCTH